jgi:hypothetical protein
MKLHEVIEELTDAILSEIQRCRNEGESDLRQIIWDVQSVKREALEQLDSKQGGFTSGSLLEG